MSFFEWSLTRVPSTLIPDWVVWVLWIALGVAIGQWIILVSLARTTQVMSTLREHLPAKSKDSIRVPFLKDGFFHLWNILPIVAASVVLYINSNWDRWAHDFEIHFLPGDKTLDLEPVNHWLHLGAFAVTGFLGWVACREQGKKQGRFEADDIAYWWDARISKTIFKVRLVCLWVNMAVILYYVFITLWSCWFIFRLVQLEPQPVLLHADGMLGFGFFADLCFALGVLGFFATGMSAAGLFDHRRSGGFAHALTDTLSVVICGGLSVWILFWPADNISENLNTWYAELSKENTLISKRLLRDLKSRMASDDLEGTQNWLDEHAATILVVREISKATTRPSRNSDWLKLFGAFLFPIIMELGAKRMITVVQQEKNADQDKPSDSPPSDSAPPDDAKPSESA